MTEQQEIEAFEPSDEDPCFCNSGEIFVNCCGNPASERPPPHGIVLKNNWLAAEQCDALVAEFEKQSRSPLTVVGQQYAPGRLDAARITDSIEMGAARDDILGQVRRALLEVAEPELNCGIDWFWTPEVLRYGPGGHFAWHVDSEVLDEQTNLWKRIIDRDLSMLLYLNDDFVGGHVAFRKFRYRYLPKKGDLLLFPSGNAYQHCAEPVESGMRYVIVTWATQTGTPRVGLPPIGKTNFLSPTGGSPALLPPGF